MLPNKSYWIQSKFVSGATNLALLVPAPPYTVFATSQTWTGNLGGLSGADEKCQFAAESANLSGTFVAWLSDGSVSAAERLDHNGPHYLVTGGVVSVGWSDRTDGVLKQSISVDESGLYSMNYIWTGTDLYGNKLGWSCEDWNDETSLHDVVVGESLETDSTWSNVGVDSCDFDHGLYCFGQD